MLEWCIYMFEWCISFYTTRNNYLVSKRTIVRQLEQWSYIPQIIDSCHGIVRCCLRLEDLISLSVYLFWGLVLQNSSSQSHEVNFDIGLLHLKVANECSNCWMGTTNTLAKSVMPALNSIVGPWQTVNDSLIDVPQRNGVPCHLAPPATSNFLA